MNRMKTSWNPIKDGVVSLGAGLAAARAFEATTNVITDDPITFTVRLSVAYEDDRFVLRSVEVAQADDGPPVTADVLRVLPLNRIMVLAVEDLLFDVEVAKAAAEGKTDTTKMTPLSWVAPDPGSGPTDDNIKVVSIAYRIAYACGVPPTKYVEERMGLSRATAGRWIKAARDRGLLGQTDPGRKGI